jgi:hypothetical protein
LAGNQFLRVRSVVLAVNARRLKFTVLAAAALSASAQSVGHIPVTQAGLVPEGGYGFAPPVQGKPPGSKDVKGFIPAGPKAAAQIDAAVPDFNPEESSLEIAQSLIPPPPPQVLSKYVVRDEKAPQFRIRDLYNRQVLEDLSLREHPGLHVGNFRKLNAEAGYEMFLDEERVENIKEFRDTAHAMKAGGDAAEAEAILNATDRAFRRGEYNADTADGIADPVQPRSGTLLLNLEQLRLTWIERRF